MSILIRGGRVVTASAEFVGDVYVEGGAVRLLGERLDLSADEVIDATGKLVLPGGIDPHTHLDMAVGRGLVTSDDFDSGTAAALFGGTTTLIDFANQEPGHSTFEALDDLKARAAGKAHCDWSCHMTVTDMAPDRLPELDALVADGISSFKMFMAYPGRLYTDDRTRFRTYRHVAGLGGVILMHAETGLVIDELVADAIAAGHTAPIWHARTRPPELAAEAIHRSAVLAKLAGVPLYIVHMNSAQGVEAMRRAKADGVEILGEVCPQYLHLDASWLERPDGGRYICSPPIRPLGHQEALWRALLAGEFTTVATDHAPFTTAERALGAEDFRLIPNGLPGVEERMSYLYSEGVVKRGLSLREFVALTSTRAAQTFGLYPRKGTIAPGADADLLVWDPQVRRTLRAADPAIHHSRVDYSCYEGLEVQGGPEVVIQGGRVAVRGGALCSRGQGRFLRRGPYARPAV
ncbi:MAG: dihydropyrimidinase [Deltaproteobacteria bacterium]|nr:dihydropyrimidinase [Deltaproteobacteria bacterium]